MLRPSPAYRHNKKSTSSFAQAAKTSDDNRRFQIRSQNEVLREFLQQNKDAVKELATGELGNIKPATRIFMCGRVKIEVEIKPEELAPELVCEECEKDVATVKCEACNEVFCPKCNALCHQRNWALSIEHDHVVNDWIRPIKVGDTSKVDLSRPYVLPEYAVHDTELSMQRDLMVPHSLICPSEIISKSTVPMIKPKYSAGMKIVFTDYQADPPRYVKGVVVSDWDFRHGESAPTITRGADSVLWYVIRIENDDDIWSNFTEAGVECKDNEQKSNRPKTGLIEVPRLDPLTVPQLEGIQDVPLRWAAMMSRQVTKKAKQAEHLRRYGNDKHLASCIPVRVPPEDDSEILSNSHPREEAAGTRVNEMKKESDDESSDDDNELSLSKRPLRHQPVAINTDDKNENDDNQSLTSMDQSKTIKSGAQAVYESYGLEGQDVMLKNGKLLPAARRTYFHVFEDTAERFEAIDRSGTWNWTLGLPANTVEADGSELTEYVPPEPHPPDLVEQMLRIVVLPEADLFDPKEHEERETKRKETKFKEIMSKTFKRIFAGQVAYAFHLWQSMFYLAIYLDEMEAATVIQSYARMRITRNMIRNQLEAKKAEADRKRRLLHSTFQYSTNFDQPEKLFTTDNKVFFDTRRDMNRYSRRVRVEVSKVIYFLNIRRLQILKQAVSLWHENIKNEAFIESSLNASHILSFNETADDLNHGFDEFEGLWKEEMVAARLLAKHRQEVHVIHRNFLKTQEDPLRMIASSEDESKTKSAVPGTGSVDTYQHVLALPMGLPQYSEPLSHDFASFFYANGNIVDASQVAGTGLSTGTGVRFDESNFTTNASNDERDTDKDEGEKPAVPFHPTLALATVPKDLTTGCAGGYGTANRTGDTIYPNDDFGATHASDYLNCVTIDSAVAPKTAQGSISRLTKHGIISRMNVTDTRAITFSESYIATRNGTGMINSGMMGSTASSSLYRAAVVPPPLPVIPVVQDLEGSYLLTEENRPKWNSFKTKIEGPTEYSCWVIPGILAMGSIPLGRAWRRRKVKSGVTSRVDAVSQLVLAGLSTFVSLISEEEESMMEKSSSIPLWKAPSEGGLGIKSLRPVQDPYDTDPGQEYVPGKAIEDFFGGIVFDCKSLLKSMAVTRRGEVENWNADIKLNKVVEPRPKDLKIGGELAINQRLEQQKAWDAKKALSDKEELRLRVRRDLASEQMENAKKELNNFPTAVSEFIRVPLKQDCAPNMTEFMSLLWMLEEKILSGQRLFIYSLDGHGRVGLVCGCLLGRMYGLTPREALFRIQVYHDCIHAETRRQFTVNCPQLIDQQDLLRKVLLGTNRPFEGVTLRHQVDPETHRADTIHLERGSQMGVSGVMVKDTGVDEHNKGYPEPKRLARTTYHDAGGRSQRKWAAEAKGTDNPMIVDLLNSPPPAAVPLPSSHKPSNGGYTKEGLSLRNQLAATNSTFSPDKNSSFAAASISSFEERPRSTSPIKSPPKTPKKKREVLEEQRRRAEIEAALEKEKHDKLMKSIKGPFTEADLLLKLEPVMHDEHKTYMESYVHGIKSGQLASLSLSLQIPTMELNTARPSSGESSARYKKMYTPKVLRPPPSEAPRLPLLRGVIEKRSSVV